MKKSNKSLFPYFFPIFFFFSFQSCFDANPISTSNEAEVILSKAQMETIENLNTHKLKDEYLLSLWHKDQVLRDGKEAEIMQRHGYLSEEHKTYLKEFSAKNRVLFLKIKHYLEIHGYPENIETYHNFAKNSFPTIIGHNHNYDEQLELIQYLYSSYKKKQCAMQDVIWIMGEMYESKFGKTFTMPSLIFKPEQEFDELNSVLNLNFKRNTN